MLKLILGWIKAIIRVGIWNFLSKLGWKVWLGLFLVLVCVLVCVGLIIGLLLALIF